MAKKGLPTQGAAAVLKGWSDANAMVIKSGKKTRKNKTVKKK